MEPATKEMFHVSLSWRVGKVVAADVGLSLKNV